MEMHKCGGCGFEGYMQAVNECNQCNKAEPLKLWDVKMELYKSGEGTNTSLQVRRFKAVTDEEWKKIEGVMNPVSLDKVFPNLTLKDQAKIYKLKIPEELRESAVEEESKRGSDDGKGSPRSGSSAWEDEDEE